MSDSGPGRPRETSHAQIREIARRLFAQHGYAATSLTQIAAEAGISRTTLFSYFPAKRDLIWEEFDAGQDRLLAALSQNDELPAVDLLAEALVAMADYSPAEHDGLKFRWGIVLENTELRSYSTERTEQVLQLAIDTAAQRTQVSDRQLVEQVARALGAVAEHCVERWARADQPAVGLGDEVRLTLSPFVERLRTLLD
ncbi:TetR/AcrR family transcriptional regulator [Glutamicibacter uratoxydans]|uniref:TetR/AcrR family transcriptional regulator n=1 Tax=Glutamicibacter uratoxydans TaxID=43667 RepID=UPI003D6E227B